MHSKCINRDHIDWQRPLRYRVQFERWGETRTNKLFGSTARSELPAIILLGQSFAQLQLHVLALKSSVFISDEAPISSLQDIVFAKRRHVVECRVLIAKSKTRISFKNFYRQRNVYKQLHTCTIIESSCGCAYNWTYIFVWICVKFPSQFTLSSMNFPSIYFPYSIFIHIILTLILFKLLKRNFLPFERSIRQNK